MNSTAVTEQINSVKTRKNLLAWCMLSFAYLFISFLTMLCAIDTADEPDGPGDPLDAPLSTYNLINSLDGYHPISLVGLLYRWIHPHTDFRSRRC